MLHRKKPRRPSCLGKPDTGLTFVTRNHQSEEVKIGTLKKIEKLSGVKF